VKVQLEKQSNNVTIKHWL